MHIIMYFLLNIYFYPLKIMLFFKINYININNTNTIMNNKIKTVFQQKLIFILVPNHKILSLKNSTKLFYTSLTK